jgi:hypothetical protein
MVHSKKKTTSGNQTKGDSNPNTSKDAFTAEALEEMFRQFTRMKTPAFDQEALLNNHKRNMEAIGEASRMAVDVMRSLGEIQTQFMRQAFEDMSALVQQGMTAPLGPNTLNQQTQAMHTTFKRAQDHASNISRVFQKAGQEMQNNTQKQMEENIDLLNQMTSKYKN